jgi:hypothetical protein
MKSGPDRKFFRCESQVLVEIKQSKIFVANGVDKTLDLVYCKCF